MWRLSPRSLTASCVLFATGTALPASAASPAAACQTQLQRVSPRGGAEDALRACLPLFAEPGCESAWTELLDAPLASPGYGRGTSVAKLVGACAKAYCSLPGFARQALCSTQPPPPLTSEFFATWRSFQTEVLRRERLAPSASDRLVLALQLWAGFLPRPGERTVLQVVTRPDVPGVLALTLWSAKGDRLGAWVTDIVPEDATLRALQTAVPRPLANAAASVPCVRLETSGTLSPVAVDALLSALRFVCPVEVVTVTDV